MNVLIKQATEAPTHDLGALERLHRLTHSVHAERAAAARRPAADRRAGPGRPSERGRGRASAGWDSGACASWPSGRRGRAPACGRGTRPPAPSVPARLARPPRSDERIARLALGSWPAGRVSQPRGDDRPAAVRRRAGRRRAPLPRRRGAPPGAQQVPARANRRGRQGCETPVSLFEGTAAELAGRRFRWPVVVKPAQACERAQDRAPRRATSSSSSDC